MVLDLGDFRIRVPSLTGLLTYKLVAGRPKDLADVDALLRGRGAFDKAAVREQLAEFDALLDTDRVGDFDRLLRDVRR
ncbi:MAG: hypothetical protein JNG84_06090 [Archangium sp.]|nr:hypothetical protein [Archangium sp.]